MPSKSNKPSGFLLTKKKPKLLTTKEPKIIAGREFPHFGAGHSALPMPTGPQSQGLAKMAAKESCGIATSGGVRVMHGGRQILDHQPAGASRQLIQSRRIPFP